MIPARVYLVVWWFDRFGGMERHVTDLAIALSRRGVQVTVFSEIALGRGNSYVRSLRAEGVRVIGPGPADDFVARVERWRPYRLLTGLFGDPAGEGKFDFDSWPTARNLFHAMERRAVPLPPEVVHVHGCRLGQHGVLKWAATRGWPCVYTEHTTMGDWGGPFDREAPSETAEYAGALACVSEHSRTSLLSYLPWPRPVHVVRHIIRDPQLTDPAVGVARPPPATGEGRALSLLAVGRLSPHKGYDILLRALALLRDQGFDLRLRIAGAGEQLQALTELRAGLGLETKATFLGQVDQAEIVELWKAADIGVVPSLTEGLPLAVVEAMAQARPIIATRAGGIPEVIRDEVSGLLVEIGDIEGLAGAIRRVIEDPPLAARLAEGARREFENGGWSEDQVMAQTFAIYDEAEKVAAAPPASGPPTNRSWARELAREAAKGVNRTSFFIWKLAAFGDMEQFLTDQVLALARAGVAVTVFVEAPVHPFNAYAQRLRRAGVRIVSTSPAQFLVGRILARLQVRRASTPIYRAFTRASAAHKPDLLYIHGWRLASGWETLAPTLTLAARLGVVTHYIEHASDNDHLLTPEDEAIATIQRIDHLAASSGPAADYLIDSIGQRRPVTRLRHVTLTRPEPPKLSLDSPSPFRVFALLPPAELATLATSLNGADIELEAAGAPDSRSDQLAGCHAAILSPDVARFGQALSAAMASFKPLVVLGAAEATPIRHRGNGLAVSAEPAKALLELAADPVLSHQFAVAARRSYELGGLQDLAAVVEMLAPHAQSAGRD